MSQIQQLTYLKGAWQGDGFILDFTEPAYSMIFGSMQVTDGAGGTAYWETYRIEEKNGAVLLYPGQMGRESGSYVLKKTDSTGATEHIFEAFINVSSPIRQIVFVSEAPGEQLAMKVIGQTPEGPIEKVFEMKRRTS
jgi:hypothetical protein